jgi:hypothetical protein
LSAPPPPPLPPPPPPPPPPLPPPPPPPPPRQVLDIVCDTEQECMTWFLGLQSVAPRNEFHLSRGNCLPTSPSNSKPVTNFKHPTGATHHVKSTNLTHPAHRYVPVVPRANEVCTHGGGEADSS